MTSAMTRSGETRPAIFSRPKAPTSGGSALSGTALVRISMAPEKRLALASVMMKLLTPVRTMAKPFSQPSAAAERERPGDGDRDRQPEGLHQVAGRHHGADADRADGEIHAAGREHHHLREADDDVDGERAAEIEEVERREEPRRLRRRRRSRSRRRWRRARAAPTRRRSSAAAAPALRSMASSVMGMRRRGAKRPACRTRCTRPTMAATPWARAMRRPLPHPAVYLQVR